MARYLTKEELFQCPKCHAEAARREFYDTCHALKCPNCGHDAFHKQTGCELTEGVPTTTPMIGILTVYYMGFGHKDCPEISIQENRWIPDYCFECHTPHFVNEVRVFDALNSVGITRPHRLPGVDIVSGGGQVVFPFTADHRLWIDGKEVEIESIFDNPGQKWQYFL